MKLSISRPAGKQRAFTLTEVCVSAALGAFMIGGIVYGYVQSTRRAEWSAYSLAAQSLAMQRLEQARAAKWDPPAYPPIDQLVSTNFPPTQEVMDIPISGTNVVYATISTTITTLPANPPLKMIQVNCVWPFMNGSVFTNSIVTYRAPDQ